MFIYLTRLNWLIEYAPNVYVINQWKKLVQSKVKSLKLNLAITVVRILAVVEPAIIQGSINSTVQLKQKYVVQPSSFVGLVHYSFLFLTSIYTELLKSLRFNICRTRFVTKGWTESTKLHLFFFELGVLMFYILTFTIVL